MSTDFYIHNLEKDCISYRELVTMFPGKYDSFKSGLLLGKVFTLYALDLIDPGTYSYLCDLVSLK